MKLYDYQESLKKGLPQYGYFAVENTLSDNGGNFEITMLVVDAIAKVDSLNRFLAHVGENVDGAILLELLECAITGREFKKLEQYFNLARTLWSWHNKLYSILTHEQSMCLDCDISLYVLGKFVRDIEVREKVSTEICSFESGDISFVDLLEVQTSY